MPSYPDPRAVRGAVQAELERGDAAAAYAALHPHAFAIASEEGAGFRELVDRLPVEVWHRDPMMAAALGQSFRAPDAPRGSPGLAYFYAAEDAIAVEPATPAHCIAAVLIGHAGALRSAARFEEARAKVDETRRLVDAGLDGPLPAVMEVRARLALEQGVLDLHAGMHERARESLLAAHGLARPHLARAENVEVAGALALLEFTCGHSASAERHARESLALAAGTPLARSGFAAPALAAQLLLAIDQARLAETEHLQDELSEAAVSTEWEPYAALLCGALLAATGHPAEAIDRLGEAERGFLRWDVTGYGLEYAVIVRASQLSALGRGDEAYRVLAALRPREHHELCPGHYVAAQLLAGGDLHGADAALAACEALGAGHAERTLPAVRLLRGAISAGLGDAATSAASVDLAFIAMARSRSRVPLRSVPPGLLAELVEAALGRDHGAEVERLLHEVARATDGAARGLEPLSRRERLILAHAERGATVATIAAELYISPNTVKTHLRRVYRKLGVRTRDEAIRRARTLGLHEITRDSPVPR